jgi:thioredoxin reductase
LTKLLFCDAFFFKDQEVIVIGGGNSALDSALVLIKIAKKVTIINKN